MSGIKFVHTNLVAKDWKALAKFYVDVFGCRPIHPERNLSGEWLGKTTGVPDARLRGVHLALPGYENGPALEIFQYEPTIPEEGENRADRQDSATSRFTSNRRKPSGTCSTGSSSTAESRREKSSGKNTKASVF